MKPIPTLTDNDLKRFWSKVDKTGECWEWTAYLDASGYGNFEINGSTYRTNRIAYAIVNEDPGELFVCHSCDNPGCVNPLHLWLGTDQDNSDDKVSKGRQSRGEGHHSILTEGQVKEILASNESYTLLGEEYDVSEGAIRAIKRGRSWRHLGGKRQTGLRHTNTTGVNGVSIYGDRFHARFSLDKKLYLLGYFDTVEEAAQAITKKRLELS